MREFDVVVMGAGVAGEVAAGMAVSPVYTAVIEWLPVAPATVLQVAVSDALRAMVWQSAMAGSFWIWVSISIGLTRKPESRSTSPMRLRKVKPPRPSSSARSPVRT